MTTQTLTLTDFLLARIAEDEAETIGHLDRYVQRDRLECEAKRQIVDGAHAVSVGDSVAERVRTATLSRVLRLLALPYSDHPDYCDEWRP